MPLRPVDLARLVLLAAVWGGAFLLYRIVAPVLGAVWTAEARIVIATLALLAWQAVAGPRFVGRSHGFAFVVVGISNSALPFALFGFAAHVLPAAYLAILNATSPLFGALIARVWLQDPLAARSYVGIGAGLIGVAALVGLGPLAVTTDTLVAAAACLVAAASYGFAGNFTRRLARPVEPATMATGSQIAGTLVLLPLLPFDVPMETPSLAVLGAAAVLGLACTAVAYLLYFRLIRDVGATRALTVTFLVPLFATGWAWIGLGEAPTARMAVGAVLVLLATWLVLTPASPPRSGAR